MEKHYNELKELKLELEEITEKINNILISIETDIKDRKGKIEPFVLTFESVQNCIYLCFYTLDGSRLNVGFITKIGEFYFSKMENWLMWKQFDGFVNNNIFQFAGINLKLEKENNGHVWLKYGKQELNNLISLSVIQEDVKLMNIWE